MLKRDIRFIFILFFIYFSCENVNTRSKSSNIKSDLYVKENFRKYSDKYKILKDSVTLYVDSLLATYQSQYLWDWEVDSLFCLNKLGDKLVTTININHGSCKECVSESVQKILGKKINGKWYFLQGANLVVPRDMYGKDAIHPLSFHELSQIARTEFLSGALVKGKNGKYVVDDNWVDEHFYNLGWGRFKDTAKYDSVHWFYITDKWKHKIDTNQYKPLRKNKNSEAGL